MGDINKVKKLVESNPLAAAAVENLKNLERSRGTTDLRRERYRLIKDKGIKCSVQEYREVFQQLASAGMGRLQVGVALDGKRQENAPDRFLWEDDVDAKALGRLVADDFKVGQSHGAAPSRHGSEATLTISYPIRGQIVSIDVPADLSRTEAAELAEFIKKFGR